MNILSNLIFIFYAFLLSICIVPINSFAAEQNISSNWVCGKDLNNDGAIDAEGEYQVCKPALISNGVEPAKGCLPGYQMLENGSCLMYQYSAPGQQCSEGFFIQNGRCLKVEELEPTAACPIGYLQMDRGCQKINYSPPDEKCPAGQYIQNNKCVIYTELESTYKRCQQYKRTFWQLEDNVCAIFFPIVEGKSCEQKSIEDNLLPPGTKHLETTFSIINGEATRCVLYFEPEFLCENGVYIDDSNRCVTTSNGAPIELSCPEKGIFENGQCKVVVETEFNYLCNIGDYIDGKCKTNVDAGPVKAVCAPEYTIENGQCVKKLITPADMSCSTGTLIGDKCISDKTEFYCPIDANQSCLNNNGGAACSPNKCIDINKTPAVDEGNIDGSLLIDDGRKTEEGLCLDQVLIFSGRGQDCKLAGVQTAFKNCCANKGKVFTDSSGATSTIVSSIGAISKVYDAAKEAYTYYSVAMTATADAAVASSMAAQGFSNALVAGFDPTTIAISIAVHFAMDYLMNSCDQMSMETAMQAGSGYCHEVGTYCKKKIPLLGCVQKAKTYCCFNSKLARIIHEQGRPQLKDFDGWGDAGSPQCRGFTPDEFSAINFAEIDLSEYVEDMVKKATDDIQKDVNQITKDFYEKTN